MIAATYVICVGINACSMANGQHCAVALGDNVQLPPHSGHIIATKDGVRPLDSLTPTIVEMIDSAIRSIGDGHLTLTQEYIAEWNRACAVPSGHPGA